jgi:ATP adenylyltransferase
MKYIWTPWRMKYIQENIKAPDCIFCQALTLPDDSDNLVLFRSEKVFVILNRYPYTSGHIMVVPMMHKPILEELDALIRAEIMEITTKCVTVLRAVYHPEGFNIGMNIGAIAGAGIADHIHMHIVPRWAGDTSFMSTLGQTRVLPESLEDTYQRILNAW